MPLAPFLVAPTLTSFPSVDTISLGGVTMLGQWILTAANKKFGWQIQKAYGLSGAVVFPTGDELIVAEFLVRFWSNSDYAIFRQQRKTLLQKALVVLPGGILGAAIGIDHPELKDQGVTSVVVLEVSAFTQPPDDGAGLWTGTVKFLQYRAPIIAAPKPASAIPDTPAVVPTAQSAQEVEVQQLTAQANALLGAP